MSPLSSLWSRVIKYRRPLAFLAALVVAFGIAAWCFRAPLLRTVAWMWIVDHAPSHADAIVVLGGGDQYRPMKAAELYHAGVAPLVLIPCPRRDPTDDLRLTRPGESVTREVLLAKGVPNEAIQLLKADVTSTFEEAATVRDWVAHTHATRIVIPTDIFHTRRADWVFRRTLAGLDTQVDVVAVNPREYTAQNWWTTEQGVIFFQVEVSKMLYYLFNH